MKRVPSQASRARKLVLAIWALAGLSFAAVINDVKVVTQEGEPLSSELVTANIKSLPGTIFSPATLSADIQRLYKTGYLTDIEAAVDTVGEDAVRLTFTVVPVPRVADILFEGNDQLSKRFLQRRITTRPGELLNRRQVTQDTSKIRSLYEGKGYHGTEVTSYERAVAGTGDVTVVWQVVEQPRVKVRKVHFVGNTVFSTRKLRRSVQTRRTWWGIFFPAGFFDTDKFETDKLGLGAIYTSRGYLDFRLEDVKAAYSDNGKWVTLTIVLSEGQPYRVSEVSVEGNKLFGSDELVPLAPLKAGDIYDPVQAGAGMHAIRQKYWPLGYIDFACQPGLKKNVEASTVQVIYTVSEGEAATIRDIYIGGNTITKDEVIRRELRILPDDLADPNKLGTSKQVLENLGYFEEVVIVPKSTADADKKDVDITVTEKRTGQLMVGAGFSSEDNLVGNVEISQSNFDLFNWPRFTGGGQRLRLRLELGTDKNDYMLSFVEPWWLDRRLRLEVSLYQSNRDQGDYEQQSIGGSVLVTRQWREFWRQSIGYRAEMVDLTDFADSASPALLSEKGTYGVSALVLKLGRDSRDRFRHATSGSQLQFLTELQAEALGGYTNLYRVTVQGTKFFPVFKNSVLRLRAEVGVTDNLSGDEVAIFDRFFAGGVSSLRGFERREVGPVDINEEPLGGRSLLLGSIEFIYKWHDAVRTSLFCDVGNVWPDAFAWDPGEMNASVGVGLQLDLPIGPIRFDYGFPIATQQDHLTTGGRLHFNLGYTF